MNILNVRKKLADGKSIFDIPLRVTFYARVSTEKYEQSNSLSNQIGFFTDYINSVGEWTFVDGYVDEGISATAVSGRTSFLKMMDDASKDMFDLIITKEISRFSRNTVDSITCTRRLLDYGVGVLFRADNINTLYPDSELRLTIMSSIAQDEVRKISERVRFGFKRAQDKGVVLGNNNIWGYDKRDGALAVNEREADVVRTIFDMYANRAMGLRRISQELSDRGIFNRNCEPFSYSTLRGIIKNPKYKGTYCANRRQKLDYRSHKVRQTSPDEWIVRENAESIPPIVSAELWQRANEKLDSRTSAPSGSSRYNFSGMIRCPRHGGYNRARRRNGDVVWQCAEYAHSGKCGCSRPILKNVDVERILMQKFLSSVDVNSLSRDISRLLESDRACEQKVERLISSKQKLLDLLTDGIITENEYNERISRIDKKLCNLSSCEGTAEDLSDEIKEILSDPCVLSSSLTRALCSGITVSDGNEVIFEFFDGAAGFSIEKRRSRESVITRL